MTKILSAKQMSFWEENGFLLLKGYYSEMRDELRTWVEQMSFWPETPGKWMKYFEKDSAGRRLLCRVENFIPFHADVEQLLQSQTLLQLISELMNEKAILFKEKINYKLPGGNGFAPHQDAPAFTTFNQKYHITAMISVDPATIENGCLEVARGHHREGTLPQEADGSLANAWVEKLNWEPVLMEPGDLLLFDSYIPHRSGPNRTDRPRRAYYITYNRASEGSRRDDYYRDKRKKFPPEVERIPGLDYSAGAAVYNLGNPIEK